MGRLVLALDIDFYLTRYLRKRKMNVSVRQSSQHLIASDFGSYPGAAQAEVPPMVAAAHPAALIARLLAN
jgi:hypothetical protein